MSICSLKLNWTPGNTVQIRILRITAFVMSCAISTVVKASRDRL